MNLTKDSHYQKLRERLKTPRLRARARNLYKTLEIPWVYTKKVLYNTIKEKLTEIFRTEPLSSNM